MISHDRASELQNCTNHKRLSAKEIVAFIVAWVQQWHRSQPINNTGISPNTPNGVEKISRMMVPFVCMLRDVYLEQKEISNLLVSTEDDDGVEPEVFALSCTDLEECFNKVLLKVETDSFEYDMG